MIPDVVPIALGVVIGTVVLLVSYTYHLVERIGQTLARLDDRLWKLERETNLLLRMVGEPAEDQMGRRPDPEEVRRAGEAVDRIGDLLTKEWDRDGEGRRQVEFDQRFREDTGTSG